MEQQESEDQMLAEDAKEESPLLVNPKESFDCIRVGMKVKSEDEAYELYNRYALRKGFSIRKGNKRRTLKEPTRQRDFLCSKAGISDAESFGESRKLNRLEARTGCKAKIRFTVENGVWVVSHFNDHHNHEFAAPEERINLRSGRKILSGHADVVQAMVAAGLKPIEADSSRRKEIGAENASYTKKDCLTILPADRDRIIDAEDMQNVINFFKCKQAEDPLFFYSVQVDSDNRIANFFWRDGRSKMDYDCFGDVVIFDTTYRTINTNLICAPFLGINHHLKNVLFGCAFLSNESTESFVWLFETFIEAMGNKQPITIFTDQDQAIMRAVDMVFTQSCHRLCMAQILSSAKHHLASRFTHGEFKTQFDKCLFDCESESEFETNWAAMIMTFGLDDHSWLKRLYDLRAKWCPAISVDIFSVRRKSTQRIESTNSVFHNIMRKSVSILQIICYYEEKAKEMRRNELVDDFQCRNGVPAEVSKRGILKHASDVYTLLMFKMFEEELMDSIGLNCVEVSGDGHSFVFDVSEDGHGKMDTVQFDPSNETVTCSCKMFETFGLLCRHALRILVMKNVKEIPLKYVSHRWTKCAKSRLAYDLDAVGHKEKSSHLLRLNELNHFGYYIFDKGSLTPNCTKIVKDKLMEAFKLVEKEIGSLDVVEYLEKLDHASLQGDALTGANEVHCSVGDKASFDALHVKAKGSTNDRIKSQLEKCKRKKLKSVTEAQVPQPDDKMFAQTKQVINCPQSSIPPTVEPAPIYPSVQYLGVPVTTNFHNQVTAISGHNHPMSTQVTSSSWGIGQPNLTCTRMLEREEPFQFMNQEYANLELPQKQ